MSKKENINAPKFQNHRLSLEERVDDLVGRLTLKEKIAQLMFQAPPIPRLGIPRYTWNHECLHGVAFAGKASVFPQNIGLAATFHTDMLLQVATAIGDEMRAKHHQFARKGHRGMHTGLTAWSPNINIFRDPRWGRGQETFGEDPYLTSRLGVAFVKGMQGDDPKYLKTCAAPKHYAAHNGPEVGRHSFEVKIGKKDLFETYLPAFRASVKEGGAWGIMAAYNRINGVSCCASPFLLKELLRRKWGFPGYAVSDCKGVRDIFEGHKLTKTRGEAAALALNSGLDLDCGVFYGYLAGALKKGLITEKAIDLALRHCFGVRFKLGLFDPEERVRYANLPVSVVNCEKHRQIALQAARESIVLLKNKKGLLPLSKDLNNIMIIGPNAMSVEAMLGCYNGYNPRVVTVMEGIMEKIGVATEAKCKIGCDITGESDRGFDYSLLGWPNADVIVTVLGLDPTLEGEQGAAIRSPVKSDRKSLELPGAQKKLLKRICETGKPVVAVILAGSQLDLSYAQQHADAVLVGWYPGMEGGNAVADVLFGDYNPAGRLPLTYPKFLNDLPPFKDYRMKDRTYRYRRKEPLYPFGYGLSYTSFAYSGLKVPQKVKAGRAVTVSVNVRNTGPGAGDEVVQLYLTDVKAPVPLPRWSLKGFKRIRLEPGDEMKVSFTLTPEDLAYFNNKGEWILEPGAFILYLGGQQPDALSEKLTGNKVLSARFTLTGRKRLLEF